MLPSHESKSKIFIDNVEMNSDRGGGSMGKNHLYLCDSQGHKLPDDESKLTLCGLDWMRRSGFIEQHTPVSLLDFKAQNYHCKRCVRALEKMRKPSGAEKFAKWFEGWERNIKGLDL